MSSKSRNAEDSSSVTHRRFGRTASNSDAKSGRDITTSGAPLKDNGSKHINHSPSDSCSGRRINKGGSCHDSDRKCCGSFGWLRFHVTSWDCIVRFLCQPSDPSSLAVIRFLFGLLMILDTVQERGMAMADVRWGSEATCRFPLINWLTPLPLAWMYVVYLVMLVGAVGIMLGLAYRLSCLLYLCTYWYIFLLDKTTWNNHSYLFGVLAFLFTMTDANRYWSVDALYNPKLNNTHIPFWNYVVFRIQIFLVYFIAGLKKLDPDWVKGYSMQHLAQHWVFFPFKFVLTDEQIDNFVVHIGGLTIDLFSGFLLLIPKTRPLALILSSKFHVMNSQLFTIGMFPYAMLGVQLIFCSPNWPRQLFERVPASLRLLTPENTEAECQSSHHCVYEQADGHSQVQGNPAVLQKTVQTSPNRRHQLVSAFAILFVALQCFLPYSHCLTKGYNNWTNGLYGYSWDMMVHNWSVQHIRITYRDKETGQSGYLNPMVWTDGNRRWSSHADMIKQYAHCIAHNLKSYNITNVEIYFDIWRSLNRRFQQRMIDPQVDLLTAKWGPFTQTSWMMPLMLDLSDWRQRLSDIQASVSASDSQPVDIVFIADFPGLHLENYVQPDFGNTSLSVLAGQVVVELSSKGQSIILGPGDKLQIPADTFHKVHTVSKSPSSYMYMFVNTTEALFLKKFAQFEADINNTKSVNATLKKYRRDPYLPHYQNLMQAKTADSTISYTFWWQSFKSFIRVKYNMLRRSIRLTQGAVYCLATNSSFSEFLNTTYKWENKQVGLHPPARPADPLKTS